jgi:hypothetical protein
VVEELYRRRAEAFGTGRPELLAEVHVPGSALLAADSRLASDLAQAGEVLRGFEPVVEGVTAVQVDGDRARLDLVDSWPAYDVVPAARPDGEALRTADGRAAAGVRLVLIRAGDGWLIENAERRS